MTQVGNVLSIPRALRLFQRKITPVDCTVQESVGSCVIGTDFGGAYAVRIANPADFTRMPAFGVIIRKTSDTTGTMQFFGETPEIFASLNIGKPVFVGLDGKVTQTLPTPLVGGYAFVQRVGVAVSETRVFLTPEFGMVRRNR